MTSDTPRMRRPCMHSMHICSQHAHLVNNGEMAGVPWSGEFSDTGRPPGVDLRKPVTNTTMTSSSPGCSAVSLIGLHLRTVDIVPEVFGSPALLVNRGFFSPASQMLDTGRGGNISWIAYVVRRTSDAVTCR